MGRIPLLLGLGLLLGLAGPANAAGTVSLAPHVVVIFENNAGWGASEGGVPPLDWAARSIGEWVHKLSTPARYSLYVTNPAKGNAALVVDRKPLDQADLTTQLSRIKPAGSGFFSPAIGDVLNGLSTEPDSTTVFYFTYGGDCSSIPAADTLAQAAGRFSDRFWGMIVGKKKSCAAVAQALQPAVTPWLATVGSKSDFEPTVQNWMFLRLMGGTVTFELKDTSGKPVSQTVKAHHLSESKYDRQFTTNVRAMLPAWQYRFTIGDTIPVSMNRLVRSEIHEKVDLGRMGTVKLDGDRSGKTQVLDAVGKPLWDIPKGTGSFEALPGSYIVSRGDHSTQRAICEVRAGETTTVKVP